MAKIKGTGYYIFNVNPKQATTTAQGYKYKQRFEMQLVPDDVKALKKEFPWMRTYPANDAVPGEHIKISSDAETDDQVEKRRPSTYLGKEPGYTKKIFNGSKVNVIGYEQEFDKGKKFVWRGLQILELAPQPDDWSEDFVKDVADELDDVEVKDMSTALDDLNDDLDDI